MKGSITSQLATAITVALALFALLAQRTIERGEREMRESDGAFDSGRLELALLHARRAAAAYVPGAPHVASGYERLRAVARGAERERDVELARSAWGAVRAAAIESRHLWQPHPEALGEADAELARLSRGSLAISGEPRGGLQVALLGGLVCGAVTALLGWMAWRADDGVEAHGRRRARLGAFACLAGVVVWGVALLSA